ncbi:schlafen family member 11 [Phacochoerus africanus]|uniref:schlafen family member 11 n=1 Tax=Phacochoerus africanus TaxID=41426 RepID=UPI001FD8A36F|nr:schlafen family member 11 [Phacochoerus africanus]XP_047614682.1 schlafen family member 11 [Phacochoerus africanus]
MSMKKPDSSFMLESSYPDLVINVGKVTLGEGNRRKLQKVQREEEKAKVVKAACALLNSGGGVIQLEMANNDKHPVEMGLDLEGSLRTLTQSLNLEAFFKTKQEGKCYYIFVKSWSSDLFTEDSSFKPRICSLSSSLYIRSGTSVLLMNSRDAFCFLNTRKMNAKNVRQEPSGKLIKVIHQDLHSAHEFFQKDHLEYGEIVPLAESQSLEFKQFSTKHIQEYVKSIIPEYVSAFANTEEGGSLFIGVDDESKKVLGCAKEKVDCDSLKKTIENAIYKLPCVHFCQSQCQIDFTFKILNVLAKGELYGYACVIEVKPFCGAVFSETPRSWMVKDKLICSLATQDWVNMMLDTDPDLSWLCEGFESQLSLSTGPPLSRPVYSKKDLEHKKDLQQRLFPVSPGCLKYTPESLWKELFSQNEGLEELINKEILPFSQGILIFSRSWAVDLSLEEKQGVICDALLITQNSPPILYTILREQDAGEQSYSIHTAFTLKQKLVNLGGYTGYLCVMTKVLHLSPESNTESLEDSGSQIDYPRSYYLANIQQMEALLQSLVIVLLSFRSFLSDQLGCEVLHLLTAQQYQIFSNNLRNYRELFIHGLPGSGKTVLAVKIMEKISNEFHCEADEILYICENQPLRNFISRKKICHAVTRKTFMKTDFEKIQHIIIDEAQNFRAEDGDWYEKAKTITHRDKDCPGILWIFLDYFQTNHIESSGLPRLSAQYPRERLTRVVRNADPIAKYLETVLQEVRKNPPPNIPQGSLQMVLEAEWAQRVQGTLKLKENLTFNQIVTYVADTCKLLFKKGYSPKNVAVLFSTVKDVACYKQELLRAMRMKIRLVQFTDANDVSGDRIVVDSVRRFSGLERNIVFGIHPKTVDSAILHTILVCLVSRANQQLHILWH